MNLLARQNLFKRELGNLLSEIDRGKKRKLPDPYAQFDPNRQPHEHDTRLIFIDELLGHLGWKLGAYGNVLEEARLEAETTKFMDYVGIVDISGTPLLLVEAKAWDKPSISAREGKYTDQATLLTAAIKHICSGKKKDTSPAIGVWDDYLRQVHGYIKTLKEEYDHNLPRAAIISGEWMVVFINPVETFLHSAHPDDIKIFTREHFYEKSGEIFKLLHRSVLTKDAPIPLRPAQLRQFIEKDEISSVFQGMHVHYEQSGSKLFIRRPRILLYPALFFIRTDSEIFTVIYSSTPIELDYQKDENERDTLAPHLAKITTLSAALIDACQKELGNKFPIADISAFPGFPNNGLEKGPIGELNDADEWLFATGVNPHFLLTEPRIQECKFHS